MNVRKTFDENNFIVKKTFDENNFNVRKTFDENNGQKEAVNSLNCSTEHKRTDIGT